MNSLTEIHPQTAIAIVITEVIGDNLCIASEDAQKVYDRIAVAFKSSKNVILSFKDAEDLTWPLMRSVSCMNRFLLNRSNLLSALSRSQRTIGNLLRM